MAEGTGFYISHDGYILTANHVVAHCDGDISAHNEEMVLKARIIAASAEFDLALLRITPVLNIASIAYLRPAQQPVREGEKVAVAGYPDDSTDLNREFVAFSTSDAHITRNRGINNDAQWMMFSYSARPGFSGGPVLDPYGNIVGVTSGGTCMSESCMANFRNGLEAVKNATTPEAVKEADKAIAAASDTNIAASTTAIRRFLQQNGLQMEERPSLHTPTSAELQAISESIVNIRCFQSDQDFNQTIRVMNIH